MDYSKEFIFTKLALVSQLSDGVSLENPASEPGLFFSGFTGWIIPGKGTFTSFTEPPLFTVSIMTIFLY
jgi:hypothetical protein